MRTIRIVRIVPRVGGCGDRWWAKERGKVCDRARIWSDRFGLPANGLKAVSLYTTGKVDGREREEGGGRERDRKRERERGAAWCVMGLRATNITLETKYKQSGLFGLYGATLYGAMLCCQFPLKLKITGIRCDRRIDIPRIVHFSHGIGRFVSAFVRKGLPEEGGVILYRYHSIISI